MQLVSARLLQVANDALDLPISALTTSRVAMQSHQDICKVDEGLENHMRRMRGARHRECGSTVPAPDRPTPRGQSPRGQRPPKLDSVFCAHVQKDVMDRAAAERYRVRQYWRLRVDAAIAREIVLRCN